MNRARINALEKKCNEQGSGIYFGEKNTINTAVVYTLEKKYNEQGKDKCFGEKSHQQPLNDRLRSSQDSTT